MDPEESHLKQRCWRRRKKRKGEFYWTKMRGWVTGKEVELKQEDIEKEIHEIARRWMAITELKQSPDDGMGSPPTMLCGR